MLEIMQQMNLLMFVPFFAIGIVLLIFEMYTPGFGVCGILGLGCLIVAVAAGSKNLLQACILSIFVLLILAALVIVFLVLISSGKLPAPLVLQNSAKKEDGFVSGNDNSALLNKEGITQTPLRPSGKVLVEGTVYDVISNGDFIDKNVNIKVISVNSNRIIVEER